MKLSTYIIDTFTEVHFSGNATGVCVVREEINSDMMLSIARELNFPVTAFINKRAYVGSNQDYNIRYFTPVTEIPACGHATLASAKVVQLHGVKVSARFHTINGIVIETFSDGDFIMMTYPKYEMQAFNVTGEILRSLNLSDYSLAGFSPELETLFIELENPQLLRKLEPDYSRLVKSNDGIKEVVITSVSDDERYDYLLRSFCPWIGIDEDPVTGSAHSVLVPYWSDRTNKKVMNAYQASKRGGEIFVKALDNAVAIGGKSVLVLEGQLFLNQ